MFDIFIIAIIIGNTL